MPKTIKNAIKQRIKRFFLRRKGVVIHNNTVFGNVMFFGKAEIEPYCRLNGNPSISIGDNFYMNAGCHLLGEIYIGKDVMIGPKTVLWARDHLMAVGVPMKDQEHISEPIRIGDDVWLGANCTILKGVCIGTGAVVGAGSVVTKDIPDYGVCVGNPARVVKFRK